MTVIVLSKLDMLDFRMTLENVSVLESLEQLAEADNGETTFVLEATDENLQGVQNDSHQVYFPATMLTTSNSQNINLRIYFDLENYPFYQKAKEMIHQEENSKGVFRFRRTVKQGDQSLFAGDLYVLSTLLGEPKDVHVKRTDQSVTPAYIILMMNFGGGKMAHIEYTINNQERIELEWSGIKNIIEFDSDEMRDIQPGNKTTLPFAYSVDSIVATAHKVDQNILDRLTHFEKLINGGTDK